MFVYIGSPVPSNLARLGITRGLGTRGQSYCETRMSLDQLRLLVWLLVKRNTESCIVRCGWSTMHSGVVVRLGVVCCFCFDNTLSRFQTHLSYIDNC